MYKETTPNVSNSEYPILSSGRAYIAVMDQNVTHRLTIYRGINDTLAQVDGRQTDIVEVYKIMEKAVSVTKVYEAIRYRSSDE